MSSGHTAPAQLPPLGIVGLDPAWSRLVTAADHRGEQRTWHLLDNGVAQPSVTLLCVHGNPSWSFLWRSLIQQAGPSTRVIAVDHLEMGFSERTGVVRRLADRIADLRALTDHLNLDGPVVVVAHDWGGPISLGWAQGVVADGSADIAGIVLMNTAVHQPDGSPAPTLIRATKRVLRPVAVNTATFIRGAVEMSRPRLSSEIRDGFMAPYRSADRREAIAHFVADIPLDADHPSRATLEEVAAGLEKLASVPTLLLWGPSDRVFSDLYLHDLERRMPHADVHRFVGAAHFVTEDADVATVVFDWLAALDAKAPRRQREVDSRAPLWGRLDELSDDERPAVVEIATGARISFAELNRRVTELAAGLVADGVRPGERVAVMIPPGIDLTVVFYACLRMGAVAVLVDSGLGPRNMSRALATAEPQHLIGIVRAMAAAKALAWPGRRVVSEEASASQRRLMGIETDLATIAAKGVGATVPPAPDDDDPAAIVFTSGSTGPSKGVAYRHRQVQAQRDLLAELYGIEPGERLVAAFAPFALYGPALGITSAVPDMDVTRPATLTASALADAVAVIDATMVFASPAALRNVVATGGDLTPEGRRALGGPRLIMSAGAPVHPRLLEQAVALLPNAEAHTPYGMTEVLPVADISLSELRSVGTGDGVCVGRPRSGVVVAVSALDDLGRAVGEPVSEPATVGEVLIRADHVKDTYVRLWHTEHLASTPSGWHRSGDVGFVDVDGYLWIGGRLQHVITAATGPLMPVALELAAESATGAPRAAAVGVGPRGAQVVALVIEDESASRSGELADAATAARVRTAVAAISTVDVAAVVSVARLPVDRRHNSKIDRTAVASWVSAMLAGERVGRP